MLPTAEEFLIEKKIANPLGERFRLNLSRDCHVQTEKNIQAVMIEFAKLHVEADLKEVSEKGYATSKEPKLIGYRDLKDANNNTIGKPIPIYSKSKYNIDKDSILNAYPISNIK